MSIRIPMIPPNRPWFDPDTGRPTIEFARIIHDLIRRTGGQNRDAVLEAQQTAAQGAALSSAVAAGADTAALSPANPLSEVVVSASASRVLVAAHTRTGAASGLLPGQVDGLRRGLAWTIFYDDPANAGGAVTYQATDLAEDLSATGRRLVGVIVLSSKDGGPVEA